MYTVPFVDEGTEHNNVLIESSMSSEKGGPQFSVEHAACGAGNRRDEYGPLPRPMSHIKEHSRFLDANHNHLSTFDWKVRR